MSGINSGNALDAGASAATKNTEFSDGIHEDVSSDLTREHGPGGKKQPWPVSSGKPGGVGMLDQLGGTTGKLGNDASIQSGSSFAAGASSATKDTELTSGIHEDSARGIESVKGASNMFFPSSTSSSGSGSGTGSNILSNIKDEANAAKENISAASNQNMTSTSNTSGGLLGGLKDKIGGVFGSATHTGTDSPMAAGASSATKDTDLSDGIYEEGTNAIESVRGATARRST
ncbi:hypothetical protein LTS08_000273 [Lithohypha guttulata]|uniref:uncharacterized protein n=1 Tax=Lithohypha guttulata TaxID=1690604 RepID=UPI002DDF461D|nr:hypothetical protein LTS08_000273 [Lithohypha guttulata]